MKYLSPEEFVIEWQAAKSVISMAKKLEANAQTLRQRACEYRRKGVNLKNFKQGRSSLNVEKLNKLIHHDTHKG